MQILGSSHGIINYSILSGDDWETVLEILEIQTKKHLYVKLSHFKNAYKSTVAIRLFPLAFMNE